MESSFWLDQKLRLKLTDPDDINQAPGFTDAVAAYEKVCPSSGRCDYGLQGW